MTLSFLAVQVILVVAASPVLAQDKTPEQAQQQVTAEVPKSAPSSNLLEKKAKPAPFWTVARIVWGMGGGLVVIVVGMAWWRYRSIVHLNRAFRETERLFRSFSDNAPVIFSLKDTEGRYLRVNRRWEEVFGFSSDEVRGKFPKDVLPPSLVSFSLERDSEVLENEQPTGHEFTYAGPDGERTYLDTRFPIFNDRNEFAGIGATSVDITERKQAEKLLKDAIESLGEGFSLWDAEDRLVLSNEKYRKIMNGIEDLLKLGMKFEDMIRALAERGLRPQAIGREEEWVEWRMEKHRNPGPSFEVQIGEGKWIEVQEYRTSEGGITTIQNDISKQKQAEEARLDLESRFKTIVDNAPMAITLKDRDSRMLLSNKTHAAWTNTKLSEILGKTPHEIFPKAMADDIQARDRRALDLGEITVTEVSLTGDDGITRAILSHKYPVKTDTGEIVALATILTDITEQKQAEERRLQTEKLYRGYFELGLIGMATTSLEKGWVQVNDSLCEIFGYSREELLKLTWAEITYPDDLEADVAQFNRILAGEIDAYAMDKRFIRKDGKVIQASISARCVRKEDGSIDHFVALVQDITERITLQEQLMQSQKMEAVGQLTGGVAHDFNNLMGVILGNLELAEGNRSDDDRKDLLNNAKRAVERGSALTEQLLSFSRQQILSPKIVDANELVSDSLRLIERTLGEDIEIETQFSKNPLPVKIDTAMFSSALLNLSLNARDAMPEGGKITITTAQVDLEGEITGEDNEPIFGPYTWIMISDTGHGIDKEHLDRVIDPFFTTKEIGQGSGLGLSMVYGFMEQSGGHMEIYSERNKGTAISLYVPVADELEKDEAILEFPSAPALQSKTILVVEDDTEVLDTTSNILKDLGYEVLEASDGPSAVKVLEEKADTIDLVFSDVVMPKGMNGLELAVSTKLQFKHIQVLLTSGYPDSFANEDSVNSLGIKLLAKPYKRAELAKAINDAFDD